MPAAAVHAELPTALPVALPIDDRRGTKAMLLFILSEAMLFLMLFFTYFYLGRNEPRWPMHPPPELRLALIMLVVLLLSSAVLHWGERVSAQGRAWSARAAVLVTIMLAIGFLVLQGFEYRNHLSTLTPGTDAYGSIFYTITSFHAAHLLLGVLMLGFVLFVPTLERTRKPPHRPLKNAALYWHFVDLVWVVIVGLLYVTPHFVR